MANKAKRKSVAFFERNSWHHRTKEMDVNGTVRYGKKGWFFKPGRSRTKLLQI